MGRVGKGKVLVWEGGGDATDSAVESLLPSRAAEADITLNNMHCSKEANWDC